MTSSAATTGKQSSARLLRAWIELRASGCQRLNYAIEWLALYRGATTVYLGLDLESPMGIEDGTKGMLWPDALIDCGTSSGSGALSP